MIHIHGKIGPNYNGPILLKYILNYLFLTALPFCLLANGVKSTSGKIIFDVEDDGSSEMQLNQIGLGINGTATHSSLELNGSLSYGIETISSDTLLSGNTLLIVDTSSDNLTLTLPTANSCPGRLYHIKKTSSQNKLWIDTSETVDGFDASIALTHNGTFLSKCSLISDGSQWLIIDRSEDVRNVIASDNLLGWWKLDELEGTTVYDSSKNSRHGTLTGFTLSANGILGPQKKALYFDGSDDLIEVAEDDALDPSEITLMAWIYIPATSGTRNFFNKGDNTGYRFRVTSSFQLQFLDRGGNNGLTGSVVPKNRWIHTVVTGDASGLKIYYNGALDASNATAYGAPNTSEVLEFGRYAATEKFSGGLDDIRIYNRALTETEIQAIYLQGL